MSAAQIPEAHAAQRAGALLRRFVASPYLTDEFWTEVGGKAMASFGVLAQIHAEMIADPRSISERGDVLRQQQTARLEDFDWFMEEAAYHKQAWAEACETAERIRARRLAEFDPDARDVDRESTREKEQRQDDAARDAMPKGIAS